MSYLIISVPNKNSGLTKLQHLLSVQETILSRKTLHSINSALHKILHEQSVLRKWRCCCSNQSCRQ